MIKFKQFSLLLIFIQIFINCTYSSSQTVKNKDTTESRKDTLSSKTDTSAIKKDSIDPKQLKEIIRMTEDMLIKESLSKQRDKKIKSIQAILISDLRKEFSKVTDYFNKGIDTVSVISELAEIDSNLKTATEGIFINKSEPQTSRNLKTSSLLMKELLKRLEKRENEINLYLDDLRNFRNNIDSLTTDTNFYKLPGDTALLREYISNLSTVSKELNPLDSSLNITILRLTDLDNSIRNRISEIKSNINEIDENRLSVFFGNLEKELPYLWNPVYETKSFFEILKFSWNKTRLVLIFYLRNNIFLIIFTFLAIFLLIYYLKRSSSYIRKNEKLRITYSDYTTVNYPVLSSVFIILIAFQFIYTLPPVIFLGLIWLTSSVILTIIFWSKLEKKIKAYWIMLLVFFVFAFRSDLNLEASIAERWFMLIIAFAGVVTGTIILKKNYTGLSLEKVQIFLIGIATVLEAFSIIANVTGRYNFAKLLFTTGYFMIISWILLNRARILILETISAETAIVNEKANEILIQKFKKLEEVLPGILNFLVMTGWIILFARNFYVYDYFAKNLAEFFRTERMIGRLSFSFESIFLFFLIIILSTIVSKIISFYADVQKGNPESDQLQRRKSGINNWLLLIRIALVSTGVLIAFAATGLPIDRLTIIIGSLGVGVGLGLQTVVNNLVSGILLAFERPFQIGDQIEISDKVGIIKEIGIRSSKIATSEGSDVIIPNGDLLSKMVINWTRTNNLRRFEMDVEVSQGSDLKACSDILEKVLNDNENIDKSHKPKVFFHQMKSGMIEFKLQLWANVFIWQETRSELIMAIEKEFKSAGIEINLQNE